MIFGLLFLVLCRHIVKFEIGKPKEPIKTAFCYYFVTRPYK